MWFFPSAPRRTMSSTLRCSLTLTSLNNFLIGLNHWPFISSFSICILLFMKSVPSTLLIYTSSLIITKSVSTKSTTILLNFKTTYKISWLLVASIYVFLKQFKLKCSKWKFSSPPKLLLFLSWSFEHHISIYLRSNLIFNF